MTTYYLDPDASGSDTGASQANAWSTLQRAIDGTGGTQPAAGDVVLCRHGTGADETVSATTDFDGNAGSVAAGFITFRGVNSSWVNDGTRYDIDANGNNINILSIGASMDLLKLENMYLHNTGTGDGIYAANYRNADNMAFINIKITDCTMGIEGNASGMVNMVVYKCHITGNSSDGIEINSGLISKCFISGNGGSGVISAGSARGIVVMDSVIKDNTSMGLNFVTLLNVYPSIIKNNVIHGNGDDGISSAGPVTIESNRFTDNTGTAIDDDYCAILCFNYMPDTAQDLVNGAKTTGIAEQIFIAGSDSNNLSGTDTDGGYTASSTDDYNLTDSATLRRVAVDLET